MNRWNELIRGQRIEDGQWKLTPQHELQYRRTGGRKEIILSGPILRPEPLGLTFRVAESSEDEDVIGRKMILRGVWRTDNRNRLSFLVERREGTSERLTLQGGWEVGAGQEILYRVAGLPADGSVAGRERVLRFQGSWDVAENKRLVYSISRESGSGFQFTGAFQTPSVLEKKGEIRYQLGIQLQQRRLNRTIILFGKWKVSDRWGLSFEMPYRRGKSHSIDFGADFRFSRAGEVSARLSTRDGKPLGIEVVFTQPFPKGQGEAFLRLRRSLEESAIEGGLRFRW